MIFTTLNKKEELKKRRLLHIEDFDWIRVLEKKIQRNGGFKENLNWKRGYKQESNGIGGYKEELNRNRGYKEELNRYEGYKKKFN